MMTDMPIRLPSKECPALPLKEQNGRSHPAEQKPVPPLATKGLRIQESATGTFIPHHARPQAFDRAQQADLTKAGQQESSGLCWDLSNRLVLKEGTAFRRIWDIVVAVMLLYTTSIFIYRIVFVQFRISDGVNDTPDSADDCPNGLEPDDVCWGFAALDQVLYWMFVLDFFVNFFFSYTDGNGQEVTDLSLCMLHYLQGFFLLNLIACTPGSVAEAVIALVDSDGQTSGVQRTMHIVKLPRIARLIRLARLTGLAKMVKIKERSSLVRKILQRRAVRIFGQLAGLAFVVHLVACGWYLCAALHEHQHLTWVGRRTAEGADGNVESLLKQPHYVQWAHAVYFVLTVFTTVGFGDMSAVTAGEIIYVCFTMLIGAVIHSIVISEVISVVQLKDEAKTFVDTQTSLIDAFCDHTEVQPSHLAGMKEWISVNRHSWMKMHYDKAGMKQIITGKQMPRALLGKLPQELFRGELMKNRLLVDSALSVPPRLPLLLALAMQRSVHKQGEVVYEMNDFPFSVSLVIRGVFAHVGLPGQDGGVDHTGQPVTLLGVKALVVSSSPPESPRITPVRSASLVSQRIRNFMRKQTNVSVESRSPSQRRSSLRGPKLYPYMLVCRGSYFGDLELLEPRQDDQHELQSSAPRMSTMRCESEEGGDLLMIPKVDFAEICEMFLKFGRLWRSWAIRKQGRRKSMLEKLHYGASYKSLAAATIQRFWRERTGGWISESEKPVGPEVPTEGISETQTGLGASGSSSQGAKAPSLRAPDSKTSARDSPAGRAEVREMKLGIQTLQQQGAEMQASMAALRADFGALRQDLKNIVAGSV